MAKRRVDPVADARLAEIERRVNALVARLQAMSAERRAVMGWWFS